MRITNLKHRLMDLLVLAEARNDFLLRDQLNGWIGWAEYVMTECDEIEATLTSIEEHFDV